MVKRTALLVKNVRNTHVVVKKAKKDLNSKGIERFKLEFKVLSELDSPYIIDVYNYNDNKNEYFMEYMDFDLYKYIQSNNNELNFNNRKAIVKQILKAFEYIHRKDLLHRDISPKNILLKEYEHVLIVKVSDFGLVKMEDSMLTSLDTDVKGRFNDPQLNHIGFKNNKMEHEIYALTYIIYFVMTGRTNITKTNNNSLDNFVQKGINFAISLRPKNIQELRQEYRK